MSTGPLSYIIGLYLRKPMKYKKEKGVNLDHLSNREKVVLVDAPDFHAEKPNQKWLHRHH